VQSLAYSLPFDARGAGDVIDVPVLIVHSERALAPDLAHAFYSALQSSKRELWLDSQGQIDFYDDPNLINPAADAAADLYSDKWRNHTQETAKEGSPMPPAKRAGS
jgi:uncharacterized protein